MAQLIGSPLGLFNLTSRANASGNSTFNGGNSRNVNVANYNNSKAGSLFTGKRILRAFPNIKQTKEGNYDTAGNGDVDYEGLKNGTPGADGYSMKGLHSNNVYDTSILNIIESLSGTKAALRPSDFAYLKDVGVYPNNRLMIARRFGGAIDDNIMTKKKDTEVGALATLISWQPPGNDFLSITFGEKWTDAAADFKDILNRIGGDFSKGGTSKLGDMIGGGAGIIPLPSFTEIFQRELFSSLGILEKLEAGNEIPSGNPNLIKEAKRRTLVPYDASGSGLMCDVSIAMTCEWELKFISGIDPTIVWMDILSTIARFGTSPSFKYGASKTFADKVSVWMNNPNRLVSDVIASLTQTLTDKKDELVNTISSIVDGMKPQVDPDPAAATELAAAAKEKANSLTDLLNPTKIIDELGNYANSISKGIALKYRVEIIGVMAALSGVASTPWHITIGNPMRPIFCSGDMLTQSVVITLGSELAFNDLPSSIKVTFALSNARPWGMQEIISKFNSGYLRTIDSQKTFYETKENEVMGMMPYDVLTPSDSAIVGSVSVAPSVSDKAPEGSKSAETTSTAPTKAEGGALPVATPVVAVADSTVVSTKIPPTNLTTSGQLSSAELKK